MKKCLFRFPAAVLLAVAFGSFARAADFYVDAASAAESPTGSIEAPFKTIKAGIEAANAAGEATTVHVKGYANPTDEQTYQINSAEDLMTITAPNITIQAWGWTANAPFSGVADPFVKPFVKLHDELHGYGKLNLNPTVITIATGADNCTIRGLKFELCSTGWVKINNVAYEKYSLGENGAIIRAVADDCWVDDCEFKQIGYRNCANKSVATMIRAGSANNFDETDEGENLKVTGCYFKDIVTYQDGDPTKYTKGDSSIVSGKNTQIIENIFEGCNPFWVAPRKNSLMTFSYNRVLNGVSGQESVITSESAGRYSPVEISHNIFVTKNPNAALFQKNSNGFDSFKFHHNVVCGYQSFIYFFNGGWAPTIYDNILLIPDGGTVFKESKGQFLTAGVFVGNAWHAATGFASGTTSLSNMGGLDAVVADNPSIPFPQAEDFVTVADTDVAHPDYYRPYGNRLTWVTDSASTAEGHLPAYIGAQEPVMSQEKAIVVNSFSVSGESAQPDEEIAFTVNFDLLNFESGAQATVAWDFDGDGTIDHTSDPTSDTVVTVQSVYEKHGRYNPTVTISAGGITQGPMGLSSGHAIKLPRSEIYVKATAPAGGNGSQDAPFATLELALDLAADNAQVYVHGGETDGVYTIATAADLMTLSATNVTVQAWAGTGTPTVAIDEGLFANVGVKLSVMTIASGANNCTIKDLAFTYSSDGVGKDGRLISIDGYDLLVENCSFQQTGGSENLESMIHCNVYEGNKTNGQRLIVRGCSFKDITTDRIIYVNFEPQVIGNVYENCSRCFTTFKQSTGGYFVSNRVVNCTKGLTSNGPSNYSEFGSPEIAYNVFVGGDNSMLAFLTKNTQGMSDSPKIHHNTIIGMKQLFNVPTANDTSWSPQVFDNLVVLTTEDSSLIVEDLKDGTTLPAERTSAFKTGSVFRNNAWFAANAATGTAVESTTAGGVLYNNGFNFEDDGNIRLTTAPAVSAFVNTTDPHSPDFYRPKQSRNPTWVGKEFAWTGTGVAGDPVYPAYIGAVEPYKNNGLFIIVK